jgi:hypothetical protein
MQLIRGPDVFLPSVPCDKHVRHTKADAIPRPGLGMNTLVLGHTKAGPWYE